MELSINCDGVCVDASARVAAAGHVPERAAGAGAHIPGRERERTRERRRRRRQHRQGCASAPTPPQTTRENGTARTTTTQLLFHLT